jgi:hypothetical protein
MSSQQPTAPSEVLPQLLGIPTKYKNSLRISFGQIIQITSKTSENNSKDFDHMVSHILFWVVILQLKTYGIPDKTKSTATWNLGRHLI